MPAVSPSAGRRGLRLQFVGRALAAGALAVVVTFSQDHSAFFGLIALGVFQVVQGAVVALSAGAATSGRLLLALRGALGIALGVLALLLRDGGLGPLVTLATTAFLVLGLLEVIEGVRPSGPVRVDREAVAVGGLSAVVGAMLLILPRDEEFTVGVQGAWGAIVAVYLGIAAVSLRDREPA